MAAAAAAAACTSSVGGEVTSGLRRAVWERVLTEEEAEAALRDLLELPLTLTSDGEIAMQALSWAGRLQQKRAYDAFYVALADQRGAVFWSADRRLVETLRQQGFSRARWIGEI
nr:type II toxin-antitoxin system VapC family toxin [Rhodothermus marinus]